MMNILNILTTRAYIIGEAYPLCTKNPCCSNGYTRYKPVSTATSCFRLVLLVLEEGPRGGRGP
jgi:hypothetical protein